ncbi:MAG: M50 family metallopeptidase [Candidatus Nanopelagicaceae bacterium]|jgi:membrane-associated protease RseP (regulator of RpoE activity)
MVDLLNVVGILAFVVALLISVMIHEAGHYLTAKRFGMKVTEFFLGFGSRIWSFRRGETEFGIKAIPAGGYCKIVGMSPREEVEEADHGRRFLSGTVPQRLIVLGAGSFLHFVLGFVLIFTLFTGIGTVRALNTVEEVVPCILAQGESECPPTAPRSPAVNAGILAGDEIVAVRKVGESAGGKMRWSEIVTLIRASANQELIFTINRSGETFEQRLRVASRSIDGEVFGVIGVINDFGKVRLSLIDGVIESGRFMKDVTVGSFEALLRLPTLIPALVEQTFGGQERDPEGLVGIVGVARTTGEAASSERLDTSDKVTFFIIMLAGLNIFVGIFNLLPILPLDGGHMAVAIADGIKRTNARIRKRPLPDPIDVERLTPLTLVVVVLLLSLTVLLVIADVVNPVRLGF